MGELYPRHEKRTKKPAETTGNRYEIENFDESDAEIEGIGRCFAHIENIRRQSLPKIPKHLNWYS